MVCPLLGTLCGNGIEGGPLSRDRCRKAESEVRQFENAAEIIDEVSALGQDRDAFVKLKLAKLVVVRSKSAQTTNPIVNAVMSMTEAFVDLE